MCRFSHRMSIGQKKFRQKNSSDLIYAGVRNCFICFRGICQRLVREPLPQLVAHGQPAGNDHRHGPHLPPILLGSAHEYAEVQIIPRLRPRPAHVGHGRQNKEMAGTGLILRAKATGGDKASLGGRLNSLERFDRMEVEDAAAADVAPGRGK